jgi:hypothetical protein
MARPRVWQAKDPTVTEADVEVLATPDVVYQALTDYVEWTSLFSDVIYSKVKRGGREDALLEYKSRTFGRPYRFQFRNAPNRLVRYDLADGPSGVKVRWETLLEPLDGGASTRVHIRLTVVIGGVYGWLISRDKVRTYREKKLHADISDVAKRFSPKPSGE